MGLTLKEVRSRTTPGGRPTSTVHLGSTGLMTSSPTAQTNRKGEQVRRLKSPAGRNDQSDGEGGFTLLETVCVIAIMAFIASMTIPMLPRGTSRSRLEAYAMDVAALLK